MNGNVLMPVQARKFYALGMDGLLPRHSRVFFVFRCSSFAAVDAFTRLTISQSHTIFFLALIVTFGIVGL